jgi:hypothetical protein
LKKRSKKLLFPARFATVSVKASRNQSFFASFCSQKEGLTSLFMFPTGLLMLSAGH